jgi:hypothetical protein
MKAKLGIEVIMLIVSAYLAIDHVIIIVELIMTWNVNWSQYRQVRWVIMNLSYVLFFAIVAWEKAKSLGSKIVWENKNEKLK